MLRSGSWWLVDFSRALVVVVAFAGPAMAADAIEAKLQICGSCHGKDGEPADQTIPIIWGQSQAYLEKQLRDYKSGDRDSQIMSSMAESLTNQDIPDAAAFLAGKAWPRRSDGGAPKSPPDAIPACQSCHQEDLLGGPAADGVAPRLAGQTRGYLGDTMQSFASGERGNHADMSALMKPLTSSERDAIAGYLSGL